MCDVCEKIRKAKFDKILLDTDRMSSRGSYGYESHTSPMYDYLEIEMYKDAQFCPKCGSRV